MRLKYRRFLSYFLLATYAGISLLGEGLHYLLPADEHHHHHGLYVVSHPYDGAQHADHVHAVALHGSSDHADVTASDCDVESHLCEICAFLYQAISQPVVVAAPTDWQLLVVAAHAKPQAAYALTYLLGPQAPRGPPLFLA